MRRHPVATTLALALGAAVVGAVSGAWWYLLRCEARFWGAE